MNDNYLLSFIIYWILHSWYYSYTVPRGTIKTTTTSHSHCHSLLQEILCKVGITVDAVLARNLHSSKSLKWSFLKLCLVAQKKNKKMDN